LVLKGTGLTLPKQPVNGGVGGNPLIYIKFYQTDGSAITDEILLGRCSKL